MSPNVRFDQKIEDFKDYNNPETEWVRLFQKRQKSVESEMSQNISRWQVRFDVNVLKEFFDHIKIELEGIQSQNKIEIRPNESTRLPGCEKSTR